MCCSHRQQHSVFFPEKHHSHIHSKILVNSVTSLTSKWLHLFFLFYFYIIEQYQFTNSNRAALVFVNMEGYMRWVFLLMVSFLFQNFTFMQLLLSQRHRNRRLTYKPLNLYISKSRNKAGWWIRHVIRGGRGNGADHIGEPAWLTACISCFY